MSENCCPSLIILHKDSELRKEPISFLVMSHKYKIRYSDQSLSAYSNLIQEKKKKDSSLTFLSGVVGLWSWQLKQQTSEWHMKIKGQDGAESSPHSTFYKSKPRYSQGSGNSPSLIVVCGFCFWISLGSIPGYPHSLDPCWFFWWCSSWLCDAKWCFQFVFHSCPAIRVDLAFCWFLKLCWKLSRWIWILNFLQKKICQVLVPLFLIFPLTDSHGFDYVPFKGISLASFISLCFRCVFGEQILYRWLHNCFASLPS